MHIKKKKKLHEKTITKENYLNTMVEFDATDDANAELLNKLKHLDVRVESVETNNNNGICRKSFWKSLKLRAALNHIGLLVGLSVYCGVGGMVSRQQKISMYINKKNILLKMIA